MLVARPRGGRPEDDGNAVVLRQALEARGEVHGVAERGIVEAPARAHIADDAIAGVDADADGEDERRPRRSGSCRQLRVEPPRPPPACEGAATACSAMIGSSSGAFQNAMTRRRYICRWCRLPRAPLPTSGSSRRLIRLVSRSGSSFSVSEGSVKPRTSQNRIDRLRARRRASGRLGSRASCRRGPARDSARRPPTRSGAGAARSA